MKYVLTIMCLALAQCATLPSARFGYGVGDGGKAFIEYDGERSYLVGFSGRLPVPKEKKKEVSR